MESHCNMILLPVFLTQLYIINNFLCSTSLHHFGLLCCIPLYICTLIHKCAGNFLVTISLHLFLLISLAFSWECYCHCEGETEQRLPWKADMLNKFTNETFSYKLMCLLLGYKLLQTVASTCYNTLMRASACLSSDRAHPAQSLYLNK